MDKGAEGREASDRCPPALRGKGGPSHGGLHRVRPDVQSSDRREAGKTVLFPDNAGKAFPETVSISKPWKTDRNILKHERDFCDHKAVSFLIRKVSSKSKFYKSVF